MSATQFQLVLEACSLGAAEAFADRIDGHPSIDALAVTIAETDEAAALWQTTALFATEEDAQDAVVLLGWNADIVPLPDRNWVKRALDGLAPITAGRFQIHGHHDRARRRAGGVSIEIDAGTAFGTGHHPTTEGCLLALDSIVKLRRPRNVLDLGCGTGVLAISAVKVGSLDTLATDIDPEAVRVALANAKLNGVAPRLKAVSAAGLHHSMIQRQAPYDLIFANILARPLIELAPGLAGILTSAGELILSGLTHEQIRWVSAPYRNCGLVLQRRILLGNWATLVFTRPKSKRPDRFRAGRSTHQARAPKWQTDGV